jgi:hypothetical protein
MGTLSQRQLYTLWRAAVIRHLTQQAIVHTSYRAMVLSAAGQEVAAPLNGVSELL